MRTRYLLLTTAMATLFAVAQVDAQQAPQGNQAQQPAQAQQGTTAGQAQGGLPGQRVGQEQAQAQGTVIHVSTAGTREIQQALNKAGYDVGNVDGQWSQQTQQAAANFQQAQGLEPTGTLTLELIYALGLQQQVLQPQTAQRAGQTQGAGQAQGGLPGQRIAQERATGPGTPLYVSPAGVRQIQQALNKAGYSVGNVDGQWSQETEQAARNFQQAQGLEPNGQLDVALVNALGLGQQVFQPNVRQGGQAMAQGQGQSAGQAQGGLPGQRVAQERATSRGTPLYMSPAGVREITQALNKAGYSAGDVDGMWQDETQQAARNFQQAQGLEPTGTLTTELMAAIGMQNWMQGAQGGATVGGAQPGQPAPTGAVGGAMGGQRLQQEQPGAAAPGATMGGQAQPGAVGGQPAQDDTRVYRIVPKSQ